MSFAITVLAVLGFLAVVRRGAVAFLRLLGRGVEAFVVAQETVLRERHGDLTGLEEAERRSRGARRARTVALARLAFWTALLIVPSLTPWTGPLYAALSALWLLPARRLA